MFRRTLIGFVLAAAATAAPMDSRADGDAREEAPKEQERSLSDVLGDAIVLRHQVEPLPLSIGGRGARFGRADVGVRVPVAGPLSLKGGLRLEYEDDPARAPEFEPVPTVGFELRF